MDNKEIVEKALKGEDVSELTKDFSEEQKTAYHIELAKAAETAASNNLDKLKGTTKEVERRQKKEDEEPGKEDTVLTQFRAEQVQKAKGRLLTDPRYPLTEAEKSALEQTFARIDSGKVDADLIFQDYIAAYAVIKKDDLLSAKDKANKMEKDAADFNSSAAGARGGLSTEDASKYPQAALDLYQSWQKNGMTGKNYSIERAAKIASEGMTRRL